MALNGKNNEEKIYNYLISKIENIYGVCGLMGNLYAESGLKPTNLQNNGNKILGMTDEEYTMAVDTGTYTNFVRDGFGYSIAQHTYWNRKQNLLNYAKTYGTSIGDLEMQLNFLIWELQNGYKSVWNKLLSSTSVRQASDVVLTEFEKPADQGESVKVKRALFGQQYYDKFNKQQKHILQGSKYYRVQCGAFKSKNGAIELQKKLKLYGFNSIVAENNGLYKVQLGAYGVKQNAEKKLLEIKSKGFDAVIIYS